MRILRSDEKNGLRLLVAASIGLCFLLASPSLAALYENERLEIFGDFRARLESDRDSRDGSGTERADRTRIRTRARLGFNYATNVHVHFALRLRSGSERSHQSPHITLVDFDDNDTGDADFNFDRWAVTGEVEHAWGRIGRMDLPFRRPNELVWDDDVTLLGLAGGGGFSAGSAGTFALQAGYFSPPVGMRAFAGNLASAQAVYSADFSKGGLTASAGLLSIDADVGDPDAALLLNGNGNRDYDIAVVSLDGRLTAGGRPLRLGIDLIRNEASYSATDPDPFTAANYDQTDGHVFTAAYGADKKKGDWQAAYYHARIETLAVNASYAQDDWVRWGSAAETRGSNLKGHELRFVYVPAENTKLRLRLYLVDAILGPEDGNRLRLDFDYRF